MSWKTELTHHDRVARLYADVRAPLHRFITRKMQQREEAEDVVQEAFTRLFNEETAAARGIAEADSPVAYLYRIASNLAVDRLRQQKARVDEGDRGGGGEMDQQESALPGPAQQSEAGERLRRLSRAIGALPPKRRQAFVLHKFRQMTYREVAHHLGISLSMVEKHITKALTQLDEQLADDRLSGDES